MIERPVRTSWPPEGGRDFAVPFRQDYRKSRPRPGVGFSNRTPDFDQIIENASPLLRPLLRGRSSDGRGTPRFPRAREGGRTERIGLDTEPRLSQQTPVAVLLPVVPRRVTIDEPAESIDGYAIGAVHIPCDELPRFPAVSLALPDPAHR